MPAANPPHELLYIYSMPEKSQNENRKAKKTKPPKNLDSMRVPAVRPAPRDTKNEKRMRKKIVHPWQHERALTVIPSPSLRCAACAAAGAGVRTTVYIKPPPAPAGRDATKGIHKKKNKKNVHATVYTTNQIVYILPYTMPYGLCTHYPAHREADCVHTTVYKKKNAKRGAKKDRLGCTQMEWGFACGSRRDETGKGVHKWKVSSPAGAGGTGTG